MKKNIFIMGSEGVIGSKISKQFESIYNVYKYDYVLGDDFTSSETVEKIFQERECHGLINLYAINEHVGKSDQAQSYNDFDLELIKRSFDINVISLFNVCRTFCNYNKSGSVINFSSIYGLNPPDNSLYAGSSMKSIAYSTSKSTVISLTKYFAKNLPNKNIRFNVIAPGGVFNNQDNKFVQEYNKRVPIGRMCNPEDLVGPILFLLNDNSSYVNGVVLPVDGGFSL